jgi:hypothetical protein
LRFVRWFPRGRPYAGRWFEKLDARLVASLWIISGAVSLVVAWKA